MQLCSYIILKAVIAQLIKIFESGLPKFGGEAQSTCYTDLKARNNQGNYISVYVLVVVSSHTTFQIFIGLIFGKLASLVGDLDQIYMYSCYN